MDKLNDYLQKMLSASADELHLVPNKNPYVITGSGENDIASAPVAGTQISTMIFPLIPAHVKQQLPSRPEVEFKHSNQLGNFSFHVKKSPAGFNVTIRPLDTEEPAAHAPLPPVENPFSAVPEFSPTSFSPVNFVNEHNEDAENSEVPATVVNENLSFAPDEVITFDFENLSAAPDTEIVGSMVYTAPENAALDESINSFANTKPLSIFQHQQSAAPATVVATADQYRPNPQARARMDILFKRMAEIGASDLHLSVSMPPLVRKDGKMQSLETSVERLTAETIKELLSSIMPAKNLDEFARRRDTDFAYEIPGLARFRANVFMDRKGMGGVFRIIPSKILTAEQLGLSEAILNLCKLSKGLVVVTGPTGSGKSTTLCAMIDYINKQREEHIITIEDPIEFVHENQKCLVNQREVHNHTDSFKDALRAALREDPDILLVGEMRDLETISIAIETAETGHLVFGTLHTTTAASTVDRIIDQFPPDRQQQIRVMLSESLKGVIAQTLLPKIGGGRVAALEVLLVTPAISNLIREGKTFQIASAMQTGKAHGMVALNDALFDLVQKGIVEPKDALIKAIDKPGFEMLLARGNFKV